MDGACICMIMSVVFFCMLNSFSGLFKNDLLGWNTSICNLYLVDNYSRNASVAILWQSPTRTWASSSQNELVVVIHRRSVLVVPKRSCPETKTFMHNSDNKWQLIRLLLREWRSRCKYPTRFHGRTVYFVEEEDCWVLTSDGNDVTGTIATELCSDHEEADYKSFYTAYMQTELHQTQLLSLSDLQIQMC